VIDYESQVQDIFTLFTKTYIQATGDLSVICWGKRGNSFKDHPSWAANPSVGAADPFTRFNFHLWDLKIACPPGAAFQFSHDSKELSVHGRCLGEISSALRWRSCSAAELERLFKTWDFDPIPATLRTFRRTFLLGQADFTTLDLGELSQAMPADDVLCGGRIMFKFDPRRSKVNKTGVYLGVGPCEIRPKDIVCAIYGCSPYVILRSHKNKYRVIGDAHIDASSDSYSFESGDVDDCELVKLVLV
jgi:hypothetical protein